MIVVSNTSPIINLAAIQQISLLQHLYSRVIIPNGVYHEIAVAGSGQPGSIEIQSFDWIESRPINNHILATALQVELDRGEAEAIVIATEVGADLLLLDERRARTVAARLGLKFIGLLGVLIEAKSKGHIPAIRPLLDDLVMKAGFWMSQELYQRILQAVGE